MRNLTQLELGWKSSDLISAICYTRKDVNIHGHRSDPELKYLAINDTDEGTAYACDMSSTVANHVIEAVDAYEASFKSKPKKSAPSKEEVIALVNPFTRVEWSFGANGKIIGPKCNVLVIALDCSPTNQQRAQGLYSHRMVVAVEADGNHRSLQLNLGSKECCSDIQDNISEYVAAGVRFQ